ncbi:MAG: glycerol-3-phosphate dehydrogenase/oxidase [Bacteroidota bacterium]
MNPLSSYNRASLLKKLSSEEYDLLIIGGGITGGGIALDAASRGMKTVLIEKQDFAAGTSSRSTKLIHGGLRYLKNGEIGLVKKVGRERAIVFRNAHHLVVPEKFLLPLVKHGPFGKFTALLGLWVYDLLAGVIKEERRKIFSKKETLEIEPLLRSDDLKGGCIYYEYRTNDARLTIEIIKTAVKYGADCINYVKAENFLYKDNRVTGVECRDMLAGQNVHFNAGNLNWKNTFTITAKQTVNATGPWIDNIRIVDDSLEGKRLHLTKGVHLVVPGKQLPIKQSVYFNAPNNRNVFAIPHGIVTYIGTTDTDYSGNLEDPPVSRDDADYLINSINLIFPGVKLSISDVISSWAGIRPLIQQEGKLPSEISRKDEIFISQSGLISIAGGKLTGYRKMAKRVVDMVNKNLHATFGFPKVKCKTKNIVICGGEIDVVSNYILEVSNKIYAYGLGKYDAEYLVRAYGKQTDILLEKFYEFITAKTGAVLPDGLASRETASVSNELMRDTVLNRATQLKIQLARAELWFAVNYEATFNLKDFFTRRTGKLYFEIQSIEMLLIPLLQDMKDYLDLTDDECKVQKAEMEKALVECRTFI